MAGFFSPVFKKNEAGRTFVTNRHSTKSLGNAVGSEVIPGRPCPPLCGQQWRRGATDSPSRVEFIGCRGGGNVKGALPGLPTRGGADGTGSRMARAPRDDAERRCGSGARRDGGSAGESLGQQRTRRRSGPLGGREARRARSG